jgi:2,3-dimethylmalate lyase
MTKARYLRQLLDGDETILAPGAYDCVSARLIEKVGFKAAYMTGFGVSASLIGKPDIGLINLSEMVQQVGNIATSINIPLIADTGYGNELNVARTVELYERCNVAAIQLEDQGFPKKCGHMEDKTSISKEEAAAKIKAAVKARNNPDTIIIARTDARTVSFLVLRTPSNVRSITLTQGQTLFLLNHLIQWKKWNLFHVNLKVSLSW